MDSSIAAQLAVLRESMLSIARRHVRNTARAVMQAALHKACGHGSYMALWRQDPCQFQRYMQPVTDALQLSAREVVRLGTRLLGRRIMIHGPGDADITDAVAYLRLHPELVTEMKDEAGVVQAASVSVDWWKSEDEEESEWSEDSEHIGE